MSQEILTMDSAVKKMTEREGKYLTFTLANEEYGIGILKIREIIGMMPITTVPQTPDFVKCRVVAEVVESHGCHAKHRVGDKFVLTPGGQLIEDKCPKNMCISALSEISKVMPAIFERLINKSDPDFERFDIVQCPDVGLDKGGWGKILMKVYVER